MIDLAFRGCSDTWMLMNRLTPDDWVIACVSLYLDVSLLFSFPTRPSFSYTYLTGIIFYVLAGAQLVPKHPETPFRPSKGLILMEYDVLVRVRLTSEYPKHGFGFPFPPSRSPVLLLGVMC